MLGFPVSHWIAGLVGTVLFVLGMWLYVKIKNRGKQ